MYDLPRLHIGALPVFADWVELCALTDPGGYISRAWVADVVRDAGLLGNVEEGGFAEDDLYGGSEDFSEQDALSTFTDELWRALERRARTVGPSYRYRVTSEKVERTVASWEAAPTHTLLLAYDIGRRYGLEAADGVQRLFEVAVATAAKRLFGGSSVRFGWPREPDWPESVYDRVMRLADELGLEAEDLTGKLESKRKDIGLDVAVRHSFGDDGPGTILYLIQCATGKHWKGKTGEPSVTEWSDLLRWNSLLVRAVAVPWRLEPPDDYFRTFRRFDSAIVLDRLRLLSVDADDLLPAPIKEEILAWCAGRLSSIPTLG